MTYLAIDPGNTTGVALIGTSGELLHDMQMPHAQFVEMLAYGHENAAVQAMIRSVTLVIIEDFQLLPHKGRASSQSKSRSVDAARGIGAAHLYSLSKGLELIYRRPGDWRIGLQLAGIEQKNWPKSHAEGHSMCAYGTGFHALVEAGLVESRMPSV